MVLHGTEYTANTWKWKLYLEYVSKQGNRFCSSSHSLVIPFLQGHANLDRKLERLYLLLISLQVCCNNQMATVIYLIRKYEWVLSKFTLRWPLPLDHSCHGCLTKIHWAGGRGNAKFIIFFLSPAATIRVPTLSAIRIWAKIVVYALLFRCIVCEKDCEGKKDWILLCRQGKQ